MKKIEINLYPYRGEEDKKIATLIDKHFPVVFLAAIGLILVNGILIMFTGFSRLPYANLKKQWEKAVPVVREIEALKVQRDSLKKEEESYEQLVSRQIELSSIFADIFESLPENIWFEKINFSGDAVFLTGYAVEWKENFLASSSRFVKSLQGKEYFSRVFNRIDLKGQKKVSISGRQVLKFEVECRRSN